MSHMHQNSLKPGLLVLSVGGSLVVPNGHIATDFLQELRGIVKNGIKNGWRYAIVVGGGGTARHYQRAAREVVDLAPEDVDWLGIHSTRLNGHLLRTIFRDVAHPEMVTNPTEPPADWTQPVLIAAGWRPGWSTDYVAVQLAKKLGSDTVINLSNIDVVYTKDPNKFDDAEPLYEMSWRAYREMVGDTWTPGMNVPFDPIASKLADEEGMQVILAGGKDIDNLRHLLSGESFSGSVIR